MFEIFANPYTGLLTQFWCGYAIAYVGLQSAAAAERRDEPTEWSSLFVALAGLLFAVSAAISIFQRLMHVSG